MVAGAGSVLVVWAADQVRLLLAAMERPADLRRVRAYALSWFERWTAEQVAMSDDDDLAGLQDRLADWAAAPGRRGRWRRSWPTCGPRADVVARVLGMIRRGPERHRSRSPRRTTPRQLAPGVGPGSPAWYAYSAGRPTSEADVEVDGDVVARRVESEAEAVQIMTIWKAKGLQFPVVCLPMLWRQGTGPEDVVYTDPETGVRTMDLAKGGAGRIRPGPTPARKSARAEESSEQLRLLYVALTRAQHHTAVWWANSSGSTSRALSRFLFAADPDDRGASTPLRSP